MREASRIGANIIQADWIQFLPNTSPDDIVNVPFAALAMAVSDEKPVSVKSPEVIIMPLRENVTTVESCLALF